MKEDVSLFKYELAFTIIIKDGARYMREWIDYHRLAGVEHFYFYDNDSTDNLLEVLQPYIDEGVVDYTSLPGRRSQCAAYNDAIQRHRFDCRYMGFIDDDEFVFPKDYESINDALHDLLDPIPYAIGLVIDRWDFGSSGYETADYTIDVMERFRKREKTMAKLPKVIASPRCIELMESPHYLKLFDDKFTINPQGKIDAFSAQNCMLHREAPVSDKIVINHYWSKSREEFMKYLARGYAEERIANPNTEQTFEERNKVINEVFDDDIVKYRDARLKHRGGNESTQSMFNRMFNSMMSKVIPCMFPSMPPNVFAGRLHEFLTCRAVARTLDGNFIDSDSAKFFEELSLKCIIRALESGVFEVWQLQLLFQELPNLLTLQYPTTDKLKETCIQVIPQLMQHYRMRYYNWKRYTQYEHLMRMLKGLG